MDREEKKGFMEDKSKYFVVKQRAVPEVLLKVVEAKKTSGNSKSHYRTGSSRPRVGSQPNVLFTNIRTIFSFLRQYKGEDYYIGSADG